MDVDRRTFLKFSAIGLTGAGILGSGFGGIGNSFAKTANDESEPLYCGWIESPEAQRRFIQTHQRPYLSQMNERIRGTGKNKIVLLYQAFNKTVGHSFIPHDQAIGDCVSHSYGGAVDVLTAVQILQSLAPEQWIAESSTEVIYGGARIQIAHGKYGMGDGCNGTDAAEFIKSYGILLRQKYLNGKYNFTSYDGNIARKLGTTGVPIELEPLCRLHPVETVSLVRSWEECRDAVANGYPVTMCSNVGFRTRWGRDNDGFLTPRGVWKHAMLIAGIDDSYKRPGALIINSWGSDWISGPTRNNQPAGSFWVDASVIDRAMKQGDSVALSNYIGYPLQELDYRVF